MEELTSVADLGRDLTCLHHIAGAETSERSSLQLFDENNLVYFSASSVVIENVISRNKEYLLAEASNGVSCVAYHKDRYEITDQANTQYKICIYFNAANNLLLVAKDFSQT